MQELNNQLKIARLFLLMYTFKKTHITLRVYKIVYKTMFCGTQQIDISFFKQLHYLFSKFFFFKYWNKFFPKHRHLFLKQLHCLASQKEICFWIFKHSFFSTCFLCTLQCSVFYMVDSLCCVSNVSVQLWIQKTNSIGF